MKKKLSFLLFLAIFTPNLHSNGTLARALTTVARRAPVATRAAAQAAKPVVARRAMAHGARQLPPREVIVRDLSTFTLLGIAAIYTALGIKDDREIEAILARLENSQRLTQ